MRRLACLTAVLAAAFAGCGGGGGTSSSPPAATPIAPASIPLSVQRSDIQVALTSVQTGALLSQFGATNGSAASPLSARRTVLRALRDVHARRAIATVSACMNATTENFTATGPGTGTLIETSYYDAACTQKREVIDAAVNGNTDTVDGTLTLYDSSGNVTTNDDLHAALSVSAGVDTLTVGVTPATATATTTALDLTCSLSAAVATLTCGAAATTTLADASMLGSSLAFTGSAATNPNGETITFAASANAYSGGPGALSLVSGSADTWNIVGGMLVAADSVAGSVTSAASGQVTAVTLTANDAIYSDTVTLRQSASGISVKEVLGTTTLATATLDPNGNGIITYADGSQTSVRNYTIVAS